MAVTTTIVVNRYDGNGTTYIFTYGFRIFRQQDINVYVNGVLKTFTTDYALTGINDVNGGTVDFVVPPPVGTKNVVFERVIVIDQQTDYPEAGKFPTEQIEQDYDRRTMVEQQLQFALDRAIKLTTLSLIGGENFNISSLAADRANKLIGFDSTGNAVALTLNTSVTQ